MKEDNVVVVISDSEEDEEDDEIVFTRKSSNKQYQLLWEKVKTILYYRLLPGYKLPTSFPYATFQELANDLKKSLALINTQSTQAFILKNLIRWLVAIKLSYENVSDCINDRNYNFILTEFMAHFVNYKCQLHSDITDATEVGAISNEIVDTLNLVFSGWVPGILMTLLKIRVINEYRLILYPIFMKYLSNKHLHETSDLISYLRLILCFRKWKQLVPLKEDKEIINEIAVGKLAKALKSDIIDLSTESVYIDPVLPKTVPAVNEDNRSFANITSLIAFASKNQYGTRILLINKSLELEDTIEQFFKRYNEYINRSTPNLLEWPTANLQPILIEDLTRSSSPDQILPRTSCATRDSSQATNKNKSKGKQGTKAVNHHLSNSCDISSISVNNKSKHLNLISHAIENLSPSFKNRDNDVVLSLSLNNVVDLDDTNDEYDNIEINTSASGRNSNAKPMTVFEKRITHTIEKLKNRAIMVGDLLNRVNGKRINNSPVEILSDESGESHAELPAVQSANNNVQVRITNPVQMFSPAKSPKPTRKRHGIVSSTTSFEGTGDDSDNSEHDDGFGVHNRPSFSQCSLIKVVEEATSSTKEITKTHSNFQNSTRIPISNISPPSTIRSGSLSRLGLSQQSRITVGKTDEERPTCSRYVTMSMCFETPTKVDDKLPEKESNKYSLKNKCGPDKHRTDIFKTPTTVGNDESNANASSKKNEANLSQTETKNPCNNVDGTRTKCDITFAEKVKGHFGNFQPILEEESLMDDDIESPPYEPICQSQIHDMHIEELQMKEIINSDHNYVTVKYSVSSGNYQSYENQKNLQNLNDSSRDSCSVELTSGSEKNFNVNIIVCKQESNSPVINESNSYELTNEKVNDHCQTDQCVEDCIIYDTSFTNCKTDDQPVQESKVVNETINEDFKNPSLKKPDETKENQCSDCEIVVTIFESGNGHIIKPPKTCQPTEQTNGPIEKQGGTVSNIKLDDETHTVNGDNKELLNNQSPIEQNDTIERQIFNDTDIEDQLFSDKNLNLLVTELNFENVVAVIDKVDTDNGKTCQPTEQTNEPIEKQSGTVSDINLDDETHTVRGDNKELVNAQSPIEQNDTIEKQISNDTDINEDQLMSDKHLNLMVTELNFENVVTVIDTCNENIIKPLQTCQPTEQTHEPIEKQSGTVSDIKLYDEKHTLRGDNKELLNNQSTIEQTDTIEKKIFNDTDINEDQLTSDKDLNLMVTELNFENVVNVIDTYNGNIIKPLKICQPTEQTHEPIETQSGTVSDIKLDDEKHTVRGDNKESVNAQSPIEQNDTIEKHIFNDTDIIEDQLFSDKNLNLMVTELNFENVVTVDTYNGNIIKPLKICQPTEQTHEPIETQSGTVSDIKLDDEKHTVRGDNKESVNAQSPIEQNDTIEKHIFNDTDIIEDQLFSDKNLNLMVTELNFENVVTVDTYNGNIIKPLKICQPTEQTHEPIEKQSSTVSDIKLDDGNDTVRGDNKELLNTQSPIEQNVTIEKQNFNDTDITEDQCSNKQKSFDEFTAPNSNIEYENEDNGGRHEEQFPVPVIVENEFVTNPRTLHQNLISIDSKFVAEYLDATSSYDQCIDKVKETQPLKIFLANCKSTNESNEQKITNDSKEIEENHSAIQLTPHKNDTTIKFNAENILRDLGNGDQTNETNEKVTSNVLKDKNEDVYMFGKVINDLTATPIYKNRIDQKNEKRANYTHARQEKMETVNETIIDGKTLGGQVLQEKSTVWSLTPNSESHNKVHSPIKNEFKRKLVVRIPKLPILNFQDELYKRKIGADFVPKTVTLKVNIKPLVRIPKLSGLNDVFQTSNCLTTSIKSGDIKRENEIETQHYSTNPIQLDKITAKTLTEMPKLKKYKVSNEVHGSNKVIVTFSPSISMPVSCQTEEKLTYTEKYPPAIQLTNFLQNIVQCKDELIKNQNQKVFSQITNAKLKNSIELDSSSQVANELQRTETTSIEEGSNLSTAVQFADLGEHSSISDSEISQENANLPLESNRSIVFYPSRDSAEDQEVSDITSQKSNEFTKHFYDEENGTPVQDENKLAEDESPLNLKITSPSEPTESPTSLLGFSKVSTSNLNNGGNVSNTNLMTNSIESFLETPKIDRKQTNPRRVPTFEDNISVHQNYNNEDIRVARILTSLRRPRKAIQPTRITRSASQINCSQNAYEKKQLDNFNSIDKCSIPSSIPDNSELTQSNDSSDEDDFDKLVIDDKGLTKSKPNEHPKSKKCKIREDITALKKQKKAVKKVTFNKTVIIIGDDTSCNLKRYWVRPKSIAISATKFRRKTAKHKNKEQSNTESEDSKESISVGEQEQIEQPKKVKRKNEEPATSNLKRFKGPPRAIFETKSKRKTAKQINKEQSNTESEESKEGEQDQVDDKSLISIHPQNINKLLLGIDIPHVTPKDPAFNEEQYEQPTSVTFETTERTAKMNLLQTSKTDVGSTKETSDDQNEENDLEKTPKQTEKVKRKNEESTTCNLNRLKGRPRAISATKSKRKTAKQINKEQSNTESEESKEGEQEQVDDKSLISIHPQNINKMLLGIDIDPVTPKDLAFNEEQNDQPTSVTFEPSERTAEMNLLQTSKTDVGSTKEISDDQNEENDLDKTPKQTEKVKRKNEESTTCNLNRLKGRPRAISATKSKRKTAKQINKEQSNTESEESKKVEQEQVHVKSLISIHPQNINKMLLGIDIPPVTPKDPAFNEEQYEQPTSVTFETSERTAEMNFLQTSKTDVGSTKDTSDDQNEENDLEKTPKQTEKVKRKNEESTTCNLNRLKGRPRAIFATKSKRKTAKQINKEQSNTESEESKEGEQEQVDDKSLISIHPQNINKMLLGIDIDPVTPKDPAFNEEQNDQPTSVTFETSERTAEKNSVQTDVCLTNEKTDDQNKNYFRRLSIEENELEKNPKQPVIAKREKEEPKTLEDQTKRVILPAFTKMQVEESNQSNISSKTVKSANSISISQLTKPEFVPENKTASLTETEINKIDLKEENIVKVEDKHFLDRKSIAKTSDVEKLVKSTENDANDPTKEETYKTIDLNESCLPSNVFASNKKHGDKEMDSRDFVVIKDLENQPKKKLTFSIEETTFSTEKATSSPKEAISLDCTLEKSNPKVLDNLNDNNKRKNLMSAPTVIADNNQIIMKSKRKRPSSDGVQNLDNVFAFRRRRSNSTSEISILFEEEFYLFSDTLHDTSDDQSRLVTKTTNPEPQRSDCMLSGKSGQEDEENLKVFDVSLQVEPLGSPDYNQGVSDAVFPLDIDNFFYQAPENILQEVEIVKAPFEKQKTSVIGEKRSIGGTTSEYEVNVEPKKSRHSKHILTKITPVKKETNMQIILESKLKSSKTNKLDSSTPVKCLPSSIGYERSAVNLLDQLFADDQTKTLISSDNISETNKSDILTDDPFDRLKKEILF